MDDLYKTLRYLILTVSSTAGSGHPTSSLSSVELMAVLYFKYLQYDVKNPSNINNDRVIFSKGHATPLYYSLYKAAGVISDADFATYRQFNSILEGHPTRRFPFTEASTGSLGQGLAVGLGQALAIQMQHGTYKQASQGSAEEISAEHDSHQEHTRIPRVYVLMGDGELAEGSVWEAANLASYYKLNNLVVLCDINRLGQSQSTALEHQMDVYRRRFEAFGWGVIVIDGHNESEIDAAYQKALIYQAGPIAIIAKTTKGKGISFLEDKDNWHGKALNKEDLEKALQEIGDVNLKKVYPIQVPESVSVDLQSDTPTEPPVLKTYTEPTATRKSFGDALVEYAQHHPTMVVLDGDVKNSTYTEMFANAHPDRFVECFIAEQTMAGVALGLWCRGYTPWISTFAAFLTRASDQLRMAALTGGTIHVNGSHAGVSIGADGSSQMGLEDIAQFRLLFDSTVVYPADAHASHALMLELMKRQGITYLRTTRDATPIVYTSDEAFPVGGSKVHKSSVAEGENTTIISAGITLFEALQAQKELAEKGINVTVIDCYSIKPLDEQTIIEFAQQSKHVIVVEDHYPEGGLGEAVAHVFQAHQLSVPFTHLAVRKLPRSGSKQELLAYEELDAQAIIKAIKN